MAWADHPPGVAEATVSVTPVEARKLLSAARLVV